MNSPSPAPDDVYLTKVELATLLRVTPRTITNYVRDKLVPAPTKVGRKALWLRSALRQHLMAQGGAAQ